MARGRMLNASVSESRKYHSLPDDTTRLAATWAIAHLDYNGVMPADPALFKAKVFPWRDDLSLDSVSSIIAEMAKAGLVYLWDEDGRAWLWFPGFVHNQTGLRQWRERQSDYPVPPQKAEDQPWIPDGATTDGLRMPGVESPEAAPARPRRKPAKDVDRPPSVEVFRSVHMRYPKKSAWSDIDEVVGEEQADLDFWRDVCQKWKLLGWNPDNLDGQMQHYKDRELPGKNHRGRKTGSTTAMDALDRLSKEEGWF